MGFVLCPYVFCSLLVKLNADSSFFTIVNFRGDFHRKSEGLAELSFFAVEKSGKWSRVFSDISLIRRYL
jgi:hypothetical protein